MRSKIFSKAVNCMDVKVVRFLRGFFPEEVSASCIISGRPSGSEESAERRNSMRDFYDSINLVFPH